MLDKDREGSKPKINFDFVHPTLVFCAIGLFIPGFSAVLLVGMQTLLTQLGMKCNTSWLAIWTIAWIGMFLAPALFIMYLKDKNYRGNSSLKWKLNLFNLLLYIFMQASFSSLISDANMLCYGTDGQNGLELVFTAWLSLPILLILSFAFKYIWKTKQ